MKSEKIVLTLGVTPGYGHKNEAAADPAAVLEAVCEAGIRFAGQVMTEIGIYPSFVISPVRVGYAHDWGCPQGGEFAVALSGERNTAFCQNAVEYAAAWRRLAELLKKELRQTTATLVVAEVDLEYLK